MAPLEDEDLGYGDRIRAVYSAACAGVMSKIRVQLGPGTSTEDPAHWLLLAVAEVPATTAGDAGQS